MHASVSVENGHETTTGENALKQSRSSPAVGSNDRQQGQGMMGGDSMKKTRPSSSSGARKNAVFSQKKYVSSHSINSFALTDSRYFLLIR